jgi:hypothetical protein
VIPMGSKVEGVALARGEALLLAATGDGVAFIDVAKGVKQDQVKVTPYAVSFVALTDGRLGVIDSATWEVSLVDLPSRTFKSGGVLYPARAMVADPETRDLWAGDCETHAVVRVSPEANVKEKLADVEFPLGLAVFRVE